jgi:hypothetical protein
MSVPTCNSQGKMHSLQISYLNDLDAYLFNAQLCCCLSDHVTDITLHTVGNYASFYVRFEVPKTTKMPVVVL